MSKEVNRNQPRQPYFLGRSTSSNLRLTAVAGFLGVALPFLLLGGIVPELVRWVLILGSYLFHPVGLLLCFRAPGGWRENKLALFLHAVGTLALPTLFALAVWMLGVAIQLSGFLR